MTSVLILSPHDKHDDGQPSNYDLVVRQLHGSTNYGRVIKNRFGTTGLVVSVGDLFELEDACNIR